MRYWTGPLLTGLFLIVIKQTPITGLTMQAHTHAVPRLTEPPGSGRYRSVCVTARMLHGPGKCGFKLESSPERSEMRRDEEGLNVFSLLGN